MSTDNRLMLRSTLAMHRKMNALTDDREVRRLNHDRIAEVEGLLGVEESLRGNRSKGSFQFLKAAVMGGRMRYRAKWLVCALLAPLMTREQLRGLVSTSLTQSAAGVLRRLQPNTRR